METIVYYKRNSDKAIFQGTILIVDGVVVSYPYSGYQLVAGNPVLREGYSSATQGEFEAFETAREAAYGQEVAARAAAAAAAAAQRQAEIQAAFDNGDFGGMTAAALSLVVGFTVDEGS